MKQFDDFINRVYNVYSRELQLCLMLEEIEEIINNYIKYNYKKIEFKKYVSIVYDSLNKKSNIYIDTDFFKKLQEYYPEKCI